MQFSCSLGQILLVSLSAWFFHSNILKILSLGQYRVTKIVLWSAQSYYILTHCSTKILHCSGKSRTFDLLDVAKLQLLPSFPVYLLGNAAKKFITEQLMESHRLLIIAFFTVPQVIYNISAALPNLFFLTIVYLIKAYAL